jgi:hypothetical protein
MNIGTKYPRKPKSLHEVHGASSQTIYAYMTGQLDKLQFSISRPYDIDDFERNYTLLKLFPEWRPRMHEMKALGLEWSVLAKKWPELEIAYLEDVHDLNETDVYRNGKFRQYLNSLRL